LQSLDDRIAVGPVREMRLCSTSRQ
jgi:hypothetical protein